MLGFEPTLTQILSMIFNKIDETALEFIARQIETFEDNLLNPEREPVVTTYPIPYDLWNKLYEISVKTGRNVDHLFARFLATLYSHIRTARVDIEHSPIQS